MHDYVAQVMAAMRPEIGGAGGYLRIISGADRELVRSFLIEERDAAQEAISTKMMPPQLLNYSVEMQMRIIIELLLAKPDEAVNVRALATAQGHGSGYVSERIEEAVHGLCLIAPRGYLEAVASL